MTMIVMVGDNDDKDFADDDEKAVDDAKTCQTCFWR